MKHLGACSTPADDNRKKKRKRSSRCGAIER